MSITLEKIKVKDALILKSINSTMNCKFLNFIMPPITYLGSTFFAILFCLTTLLNKNIHINSLGYKATLSLIISSSISLIIKTSVNRIRPYIKLKNLYIKKIGIDQYSFPSGHTNAAFTLAIITSLFYHNLALISIPLACCVGISRMYLGVHYPTDVLCGILLGTITSISVFYII